MGNGRTLTVCAACVLPLLLVASGCGKQSSAERDAFLAGREQVTIGNYQEGIAQLSAFLTAHPQGRYSSRAQFFIAKAHLGLDDLVNARLHYEQCIALYPDTDEAHKSRFKIALIDMVEGHTDRAMDTMRELAAAPDGPLAAEAHLLSQYLEARYERQKRLEAGDPDGTSTDDVNAPAEE